MKAQLEAVTLQMYRSGMHYDEAIREFKKQFIVTLR
jgi:hypothetical protein